MSDDTKDHGFSDDERRALARVLDEIIPPSDDGRLPGAGGIGLVSYVEEALRKMPELRAMIAQSLSALDDLASRRGGQPFVELSREEQSAAMNQLESTEHAFPPVLMLHTYTGYYQHARVLEGLGLEPRPPHPEGYEMGPNDLTLLDEVRRRPALYRRC